MPGRGRVSEFVLIPFAKAIYSGRGCGSVRIWRLLAHFILAPKDFDGQMTMSPEMRGLPNSFRMSVKSDYGANAKTDYANSILAALTVASFLPQNDRIIIRQDCGGISPTYIFFNLLVATDQLGFHAYLMVANSEMLDEIVASPPTAGDWLNLVQFGIVWLMNSYL